MLEIALGNRATAHDDDDDNYMMATTRRTHAQMKGYEDRISRVGGHSIMKLHNFIEGILVERCATMMVQSRVAHRQWSHKYLGNCQLNTVYIVEREHWFQLKSYCELRLSTDLLCET